MAKKGFGGFLPIIAVLGIGLVALIIFREPICRSTSIPLLCSGTQRQLFRQYADTGIAPEGLNIQQATPVTPTTPAAMRARRRFR
jgi:hypothetical protein